MAFLLTVPRSAIEIYQKSCVSSSSDTVIESWPAGVYEQEFSKPNK